MEKVSIVIFIIIACVVGLIFSYTVGYDSARLNNIYTEQWFSKNCVGKTIHNIAENKNIINCQNACSTLVYHMKINGKEIGCFEAFSWD